ncbi:hypothetical protein CC80DRAFT_251225 [Byssothecium circinans]|uniref:Uncharacterized protein n=1 Tax=Byssothecium circinans TaxID=147558 RepID=A0A6A5TCH4_9PLEO|nr:hypothetical protein CC80DRAFT_251225 [Byssothecium circinans]
MCTVHAPPGRQYQLRYLFTTRISSGPGYISQRITTCHKQSVGKSKKPTFSAPRNSPSKSEVLCGKTAKPSTVLYALQSTSTPLNPCIHASIQIPFDVPPAAHPSRRGGNPSMRIHAILYHAPPRGGYSTVQYTQRRARRHPRMRVSTAKATETESGERKGGCRERKAAHLATTPACAERIHPSCEMSCSSRRSCERVFFPHARFLSQLPPTTPPARVPHPSSTPRDQTMTA